MRSGITFNVDKLIKKLDIIQKSHLPKASEQALRSLGFDLREVLQREMKKEYESPSAYTLRSPYFKQDGMTLTVGISDKANSGLSPAQYLAPTDKTGGRLRKPAAPTSLDGAILARFGIKDIAVPVESSRAGSQFLNAKGGLRSRKVQYLLDQLANPDSGRERIWGEAWRQTPSSGHFQALRAPARLAKRSSSRNAVNAFVGHHGVIRKPERNGYGMIQTSWRSS